MSYNLGKSCYILHPNNYMFRSISSYCVTVEPSHILHPLPDIEFRALCLDYKVSLIEEEQRVSANRKDGDT